MIGQDKGYTTPKVDVRGAAFRDGPAGPRILMVRSDPTASWTLPGGWCDVNESPSESVVKEIREESGFEARAVKLAALLDRRRHPHPTQFHHVYKLYFLCELTGGQAGSSIETDAVDFFAEDQLAAAFHPPHHAGADPADVPPRKGEASAYLRLREAGRH